jgi:hypothetical protein
MKTRIPSLLLPALFATALHHASAGPAADPATLKIAPGFKVELLYTVPKAEQGSWVAMTQDAKGRLIVGDQYGALYRVTLPAAGSTAEPQPLRDGQ